MLDLSDLIARVEAASGPDRGLDCLIENILGIAKFERDPRVLFGDADYERVPPKPYTASIDAALTLLPEGFTWAGGDLSDNNVPWCCITADDTGDDYDCLNAATFCLALLSAILKARQAAGGRV